MADTTPTLCHALVLLTPPATPALTAELVEQAWSQVSPAHRLDGTWLAAGEAWEGLFRHGEAEDTTLMLERVRHLLRAHPIDANIVDAGEVSRRKTLLIADMESTIIEQEMLDELGDFIGVRVRIEAITARAMRGELDFAAALAERVGLLAGLEAGVLDEVAGRITLMPGAKSLVATMKANGAFTALVSGGFTVFTARVAAAVGFDTHLANTIEVVDGRLTGRVVPPILGREAKLATLHRYAREQGLLASHTLAVGDGANDLDMVAAAGLGVAFRAKPVLARQAHARIDHGDLTGLLYLQGYRREEFVAHA